MKEIVKLMGANETGIRLMDEVYEFEKQLAEVHFLLNYSSVYT